MEKITIEQYAEAVKVLVQLVQNDTGGARVTAQVLRKKTWPMEAESYSS